MTIEHVAITDPQIHEPKGASTAANKSVYYADGAGSGSWTLVKDIIDAGWEYSLHSGAVQTFTTTASKLSINGSGAASTSVYLPASISGVTTLWDTVNNKITPVAIGDTYDVRLDLPVTAVTGSPAYLEIQLDIGGGVSPSNVISTIAVPIYKSAPFTLSVAIPIFCLTTFVSNGGQFFLNVDAATSIGIDDPGIFISRNYRNI